MVHRVVIVEVRCAVVGMMRHRLVAPISRVDDDRALATQCVAFEVRQWHCDQRRWLTSLGRGPATLMAAMFAIIIESEGSFRASDDDPNKKPGEAGLDEKRCREDRASDLLRQLGDPVREPRDFAAGCVLVNDVALSGLHQLRLGGGHRLDGGVAITLGDRFFDHANCAAHLGAPRFVDEGATGNLACRLLGGGRIGHALTDPSAATVIGRPG